MGYTIKAPIRVIDLNTGAVLEEKTADWHIITDITGGRCEQCGKAHPPEAPHDAFALQYQYTFYARHNRWPTWADAMSHCAPDVQRAWKEELCALRYWTE
jgi:hypothetical protein